MFLNRNNGVFEYVGVTVKLPPQYILFLHYSTISFFSFLDSPLYHKGQRNKNPEATAPSAVSASAKEAQTAVYPEVVIACLPEGRTRHTTSITLYRFLSSGGGSFHDKRSLIVRSPAYSTTQGDSPIFVERKWGQPPTS
jgi:hypothetical protein